MTVIPPTVKVYSHYTLLQIALQFLTESLVNNYKNLIIQ